jgi:hypothetical protein
MTLTNIQAYLTKKSIEANAWLTGLENKIPLIILSQEYNIIPDSKKAIYRFNNSEELLEIAYGRQVKQSDGSVKFVTDNLSSNIIPDQFISYNLIAGFSDTIRTLPGGSYLTR